MCVIALCDDYKMFGIASKRIGYFKLRIEWLLRQFSIMMGLYGIISEWWYISLCVDDGGFRSVYYHRLFHSLTVMIVTLIQSQRDCQQLLCYFFKPRLMVVGPFLLSFHRSIPRSSLGWP
jgi:hypothetical protein